MKKKNKFIWPLVASLLLTSYVSVPPQKAMAAASSASVDINTTYQTLEGFGAAVAWYNSWITTHPNKTDLYKVLFFDSGLDILRLRNTYRNSVSAEFAAADVELVKIAKILNPDQKVFLSSWSPPGNLKKDGIMNGGTLIKEDGAFPYNKFGDYWYNSLKAYESVGIVPDYISIQNEPDYESKDWETCIFKPVEDANYPGYGKALDAVYDKIKTLPSMPKILAAEAAGIGNNLVQDYAKNMDMTKVYGIAHHLYNGGDGNNPDSFNSAFQGIAKDYPNIPKFQTEYDYGTPFNTAELIYNSFVIEGVNSYFYWDLTWDVDQKPLVYVENPVMTDRWTKPKGFAPSDYYPIMQQFAKFTEPGYKRVSATSTSNDIKILAFASPDKEKLTVILINKASTENTVSLDLKGYSSADSVVYRTTGSQKFAKVGSFTGNSVTLPAQSVVTVALGETDTATPPPLPSSTPLPSPSPTPLARSAFDLIEAESFNGMQGVQVEALSGINKNVGYIENNDYLFYKAVDFGAGATGFEARVASSTTGGNIEIRLDNVNGNTVAKVPFTGSQDWGNYVDIKADVSGLEGEHDLYLVFTGGSGYLFNIDNFRFTDGSSTSTPVPTPTNAIMRGDVNDDGTVDSTDLALIKRHILRVSLIPSQLQSRGDVNGDGSIDSTDLAKLKRFILKIINIL